MTLRQPGRTGLRLRTSATFLHTISRQPLQQSIHRSHESYQQYYIRQPTMRHLLDTIVFPQFRQLPRVSFAATVSQVGPSLRCHKKQLYPCFSSDYHHLQVFGCLRPATFGKAYLSLVIYTRVVEALRCVRASLPQLSQLRLRLLYATAPHDLAALPRKFFRVVVP